MKEITLGEIKKEVESIRIERDELTKTRYFGHWTLSRQISPQRVVLNPVSRTKEDAICELVQAVSNSHKIHDKEKLFKRILEREQIEATGIGEEVAILHARTDAVEGIILKDLSFPVSAQAHKTPRHTQNPGHYLK